MVSKWLQFGRRAAVAFAALAVAAPVAAQVNVGVDVGSLQIETLYQGAPPSATGASCSFNANLQGYGFLGNLCDSMTVDNIPAGTYTLSLGYAFGGTLLPPVAVTIASGETTTQTFDVTPVVGIVSGSFTVAGLPPPSGYGVCGFTNGKACESKPDGTFALMLPAGPGSGTIWGDGCECLQKGTFSFVVTAGEQHDIGNTDIVPGGTLTVKLTYNGAPPSATGAACSFNLNLEGFGFLGNLCDASTTQDIKPGSYDLQLGYAFGGALLPPVPVTILSGQTTVQTFDVSALVGIVTGSVTVNHAPPPSGFGACVQNNGQACGSSPDGSFTLMVPAGNGSGFVWGNGCTCINMRTFSFTAIAGESTSVGVQDVELGALKVDILYNGSAPSTTGAACNFNLNLIGYGFLGNLCDTQTTSGIPAGTYQLQLGYAFGDTLLPPVPISIVGGTTSTQTFDVSTLVGIVSGTVSINGGAPGSGYGVCGTTNGKACKGFPPGDGSFSLMLPAGPGSGWVYGSFCECIQLGTFVFNVAPGVAKDIGDPLKRDTTAPVLTLPSDITATATSLHGAAVSFDVSALDDVDGSVPVACSAASGDTFAPGTTTVTCNAHDAAGNVGTGEFRITVTLPVPTAVVSGGGPYGGTVTLSALLTQFGVAVAGVPVTFSINGVARGTAVSDAAGVATLALNGFTVLGAGPNNGGVEVSFTTPAGDGSATGGVAVTPASLTITAADATREFGTANPDFSVTYSGFVAGQTPAVLGGVLSFSTAATVSSPVGSYTVTPGGVTSANYAIAFVPGTLRVVDTTPPLIASVVPSLAALWPVTHKMVSVNLAVSASDATSTPVCAIARVISSEAANGGGDGNSAVDWIVTGPLTVDLRAERSAAGPGRVYTITVSCRDRYGNAASKDAHVVVPHNQ